MHEETSRFPALRFHGGKVASAVPFLFFIAWAVTISVLGTPDENGLILGAIIGITLGMFLCRGDRGAYAEQVFEGIASKTAAVTILAWFWAGMFAQVLRDGGLVDGLIWLGGALDARGGVFVGATFLLAALFSTAVGTGYGTVVAFAKLMYPAGLVMGADPTWLLAAILSGAAFGDNLAPVSDTTVVSATTQETDIPGVVRSRFKYALAAAIPALLLFIGFGGGAGGAVDPARARAILETSARPEGLLLLVPFALVIALALRGHHILVTLTAGILAAIALAVASGLAAPARILFFDSAADRVGGALVTGISGYVGMVALILLIVAGTHIMRAGGALDALVDRLARFAAHSAARAEVAMWSIVFSLNVFITMNTAAEITAAPVVARLGKRFHIHPYRRANLLDAVTSALGYIFPWGGGVLIAYATIRTLAAEEGFAFVTVVAPTDVWPYVLHGWFLALVMLGAAITGWGRRYEGPDGRPVKTAPDRPPPPPTP